MKNNHYTAALFLALLDWGSKWWALQRIGPGEEIPLIPGLFQLILAKNPGIAFSFFSDGESLYKTALLTLVNLLGLALIVYFGRGNHFPGRIAPLCLTLVMGGILGNSIDRLYHGWVTDFLDVFWGAYHWPTFNLADSYITVGVLVLVTQELFFRKPPPVSSPQSSDSRP